MSGRCDVEGVFRSDKDLVEMAGDSVEGAEPETWNECRFCCSNFDLERYFGGKR